MREHTHKLIHQKQQTDLSAARLSAGEKTRYDKLLRRPEENKFRRADETHNCVGLTGGKLQIAAIRRPKTVSSLCDANAAHRRLISDILRET